MFKEGSVDRELGTARLRGEGVPKACETLEWIEEVLEEIRELSIEVPVLVEGQRDIVSLQRLGIRANVRRLKGRGSILRALEDIRGVKEAIILTDFDRGGERLANYCAKHLRGLGVRPNLELRRRLIALAGKEIRDVEGLAEYVARLRTKHPPAQPKRETS
jgi:5S rRNA maturation endonuclease (ribonuclease M5)